MGRLSSLWLDLRWEKDRESFPLLLPSLTTVSPQTHLLSEVGEGTREEKEEGGWAGEGGLPQRVWAEQTVLHAHAVFPFGGPAPPLCQSPSPRQGPVLRLPCSPANSPGFATAFFSFCSFLKLPFKCFLAQMPHASVQC